MSTDLPPDCPPLAWPNLSSDAERQQWYARVIHAYADLWDSKLPSPHNESEVQRAEKALNCPLPAPLRAFYLTFGVPELAERLCALDGKFARVEPLREAYPGIADITTNPEELALADELVAFGDYLGNGNMFCFHRRTGEVYYFDHDTGDMLTRFFPSVTDYLDALMIRSLGEVHDDNAGAEQCLIERFGKDLVRKWLY